MTDKEFETMLLYAVAEVGGTVKERKDGTLYAREWRVKLPKGGDTTIYWNADDERPEAGYLTRERRGAPWRQHKAVVETPQQLAAFLRRVDEVHGSPSQNP